MRESLRTLLAQPGFSWTVVLVLGLCMGANSALFTVVNGLLLRPLPFPDSEQLVEITVPNRRTALTDLPPARTLELTGSYRAWNFAVPGADGVRMAYGFRVSSDLIPLLQVRTILGRPLTRGDFDRKLVMISHEYWIALGARPDIAGQPLTLDGEPHFIVGVLPADFYLGVRDAKLIVPNLHTGDRMIARLRPGVTPAQAKVELDLLVPGGHAEVIPLARAFRGTDSRAIVFLLGTAGFVLLITCANLANLQLVRGLARRREFAIRAAMGASRSRLLLKLAAESALLGSAGAALGLVLTRVLNDVILAALPANIARRLAGADALAVDSRVLAFSGGLAAVTVILFGLLPGLSTLRFDIMAVLRDAARGSSRDRHRYGQALVMLEIALALMLLSGAGLTFKSLMQLQGQYLGFRPEGILRAMTDFSTTRYPADEQRASLYRELERRMRTISGVAEVGIVAPQAFPFGGPSVRGARFEIFGDPAVEARAEVYSANPAYLAAIRLPLVRGRWFTERDTAASDPVAVVSESVAHRYWGATECIGRKVRLNAEREGSEWVTIVGVVGDVKNPTAEQWQPTAYRPFAQSPYSGATLLVRTSNVEPQSITTSIRRELRAIDATAPEFRLVAALDRAIYNYVQPQRFTTTLLVIFAVIGIALAAAGVYSVMRVWVASRTAEVGIRLALGAEPRDILKLVLGRAGLAGAIGVVTGVAGTYALRKAIAAHMFGVSPADPMVLVPVALGIFAVAVVAAWAPAWAASRIDPAEALRAQ